MLMHSPDTAMLCLGVVAREYDLGADAERFEELICTPCHDCGLGPFIKDQCCLTESPASVIIKQHVPVASCLLGVTVDCVPP